MSESEKIGSAVPRSVRLAQEYAEENNLADKGDLTNLVVGFRAAKESRDVADVWEEVAEA